MVLEKVPMLFVQRLIDGGHDRGKLTLRGGLRIEYTVLRDPEGHLKTLAVRPRGRPRWSYEIRDSRRARRVEVRCPDCGRWVEQLYWTPSALASSGSAGECRRCCRTKPCADRKVNGVPGFRADLRAGNYGALIKAMPTQYVSVRTAMEREGVTRTRIFTHRAGHRTRWEYRNKPDGDDQ